MLSGSQALKRPKTTGASGSAIFTVDDNGSINYEVRLTGLDTEVRAITIEMPIKNRRRILADIFGNYRDGVVSGDSDSDGTEIKNLESNMMDICKHYMIIPVTPDDG